MSRVKTEFQPKEAVFFLHKRGSKIYRIEAVVLKINKKYIRIKAKMDGRAWQFTSVRPEELEKVSVT